MDIRMPAPPGAVDDWGDRPDPRVLVALTGYLVDQALAVGSAGGQLRQLSQRL